MAQQYTIKMKIGEALTARGMSQKELAALTGLRESTISDMVRQARTGVNKAHLSKVAEALGVTDIRELIDFEQ